MNKLIDLMFIKQSTILHLQAHTENISVLVLLVIAIVVQTAHK